MKLILFDIDGTLLLTGGAGRVAFEKAFEELFGVANAWGKMIPNGKTDPVIIGEIANVALGRTLKGHEYDQLCERYSILFRSEIGHAYQFRLMPGVLELLAALGERKDAVLGIATGNFEEVAWLKLERGNIRDRFKFGGFGSDSENRLELTRTAIQRGWNLLGAETSPKEVFLVGDTIHDIMTGKSLGVKTVAVATGRTSKQDLSLKDPDLPLDSFSKVDDFLNFVFS